MHVRNKVQPDVSVEETEQEKVKQVEKVERPVALREFQLTVEQAKVIEHVEKDSKLKRHRGKKVRTVDPSEIGRKSKIDQ